MCSVQADQSLLGIVVHVGLMNTASLLVSHTIFIKETIDYKIRNDLSVFIPHVYESLFVEITSNIGKNMIIGVIYRPNTFPRADVDIFTTTLFGRNGSKLITKTRKVSSWGT